jgi:hypothetical protein
MLADTDQHPMRVKWTRQLMVALEAHAEKWGPTETGAPTHYHSQSYFSTRWLREAALCAAGKQLNFSLPSWGPYVSSLSLGRRCTVLACGPEAASFP